MSVIFETKFDDLKLFRKGKVREVYDIESGFLIVATDRISAFDVVMNEPIPGKGVILSQISNYWFLETQQIIKNHLISTNVDEFPEVCLKYKNELIGRSMLVKKCKPLPVEFIVRGYIAGSAWKSYKANGKVNGISLPLGMKEYQKLDTPIFTPSTKAESGHDENITFEECVSILGVELAMKLKNISLQLYKFAEMKLENKGVILADTKFEFGIDSNGEVLLIDEALTPDSSRFWLLEDYEAGRLQTNFDKQVLRDWLEKIEWDKNPPPPQLPQGIINSTLEKYQIALNRIIE